MAGILVIGFVFVDIKGFPLGKYVPQGRNLGNVRFLHGGVSRNVVETIANTAMPVTFATLCEDSALGNDVLKRLTAAGADVSRIATVPDHGIGQWMVILDESGNVAGQISCPPDRSALEHLIAQEGESMVRDADSIVLELDTSELIDQLVIGWAKKYAKPVYTVVGNMSVILSHREFVSSLDCFVCNEIEIGRYLGENLDSVSPEIMLSVLKDHMNELGCPSAIITMGSNGSVYCDARTGESGICPIAKATLVDSTGAGDAFLSGAVMAFSRGLPISSAARAGTLLAAAAIGTEESSIPPMRDFWDTFR